MGSHWAFIFSPMIFLSAAIGSCALVNHLKNFDSLRYNSENSGRRDGPATRPSDGVSLRYDLFGKRLDNGTYSPENREI